MSSLNNPINATPKPFQGIWEGESKIVIGIDIGTTQSGVAFTFLQQGANQVIHRVTQWPGQEASGVQSKIPTVVWYDLDGKAVSFGAEATSHQAEEDAEDNGWKLAKHFKLHLHPSDMKAKHDLKLDRYLLKHTQAFFEARIIDGKMLWESYQHKMEIVIAHPNGWGIREQTFLRTAAVDAGITTHSLSRSRIKFVTEAEASVHFCIYHTNLGNRLQAGTKLAVCDAGGSTVDTTVYLVTAARPALRIEETTASACVQAGAIFVDDAARNYLNAVFTNASLSRDDVHDYTTRGVKDFENATKRNFLDENKDQMVEIAGPRVNIPSIRTRRGRMTMPGTVVKSFFDICVDEITTSVDQQIKGADVSGVVLDVEAVDRRSFRTDYPSPNPDLEDFETDLLSYTGEGKPRWAMNPEAPEGILNDGFQNSCTIAADLTNLSGALEPKTSEGGKKYWRLHFDVCIRFGGTELEAYLEWEEGGITQRGEAAIIPE
ncbi:hypothetical protein FRC09_005371 [Ceratobasidium sp. 395]|nr:hypothetical protein FRC09_005371 [Ceratobasidium sp. 395]